ncbi:hypothetical protein HRbin37_01228 [bacterium HR37]|nr:hypothetical protein HRbin37_01228 [bacterium HR37]
MRASIRRIIAASEPKGNRESVKKMLEVAEKEQADAIVVLGDLAGSSQKAEAFAELFKLLGSANLPAYYIPGPNDAPVSEYLREAYNIELVYPYMHGVHGTFAFAPGHIVFAGMGGEIREDNQAVRDEINRLCYLGWEVEYRLKILNELKDYPKVFLFITMPHHRGLAQPGSEVLAQLIKTHNPQLVVVHGSDFFEEWLGSSLVVSPGLLTKGQLAVVDLRERKAKAISLS